jgi:ferritin-like metal-binding protein YciE
MPETMTDPRELLLHELRDIYYAENLLVKALPKRAKEASDSELRQGFEHHLEETKQQVLNLREAFSSLGEAAEGEKCPGIEGIKAEHDQFMGEHETSPEVCDIFLTGAGGRTEHYEIAAYSGAITMARALGERDVVKLLKENLSQEKEALKVMEACGRRLAKSSGGNGNGATRKRS